MSHLLAISIGPVQDFIAAARRTADLYAGSQILQEVCKAAAEALEGTGAKLIFPSSSQADGANKILVELEGDPKSLAEAAKKAARDKLEALWNGAFRQLSPQQQNLIHQERAKKQLETFLEIYAAWYPFENDHQYAEARKKVERLVAGRKALRDFAPLDQQDQEIPKSPLDPSRAAVINPREWDTVNARLEDGSYKPLRIKPTEHLDAVSLLKRIYGVQKSGKVVDTRTMARRAKNPEAKPGNRYGEDDDHIQEDQPYFAILVADGDKMGALIDSKKTVAEHKELSSALATFAKDVERTVGTHGLRVYSGGDDVLAMLPVNTAIACAKELARSFAQALHKVTQPLPDATLSVGVAIVHYREPLSISLEAAREAEKAAKNKSAPKDQQGNRLAVALHTRGGAPITVVRQWGELKEGLDWDALVEAYNQKRVSRGLAYELAELAREWRDDMDLKYLQAEAERILRRKEGQEITLPTLHSAQDLKIFANQLVVARFLSGLPSETPKEEQHA